MGTAAEILQLADPRTGRPRGEVVNSRQHEVARTVERARTASEIWARLTPRERQQRLAKLAEVVEEHADDYVRAESAGTGKPLAEAAGEVALVADLFRFYAWAARTQQSAAAGSFVMGHESWVRWEPMGVIGAILPWNYPFLMAAWRCAPALAAGNTVVAKPAELTPDSAMLLAEHARQTLGSDVLQCATGDRTTGRLLVAADIDAIAFTGSLAGGLEVARTAGVRRVSLELGGNAPVIVLPDAPESTYADLAAASTYNAGQSCAAPARVITLEENYDDVVRRLVGSMKEKAAGRDFGPLNNADQRRRCASLVSDSKAAVKEAGPCAPAGAEEGGFWQAAMVLADLPQDDGVVTEEVFGPVLTVQRAPDLATALRMANGQPQALAASIWTTDIDRALRIATELNAGEVWVNCHMVQTAELPHSGRGSSGGGTDLSTLALHDYQRPKTVTVRLRSLP